LGPTKDIMATETAEKLNIGLQEDQRDSVISKLKQILADQHVLYVKTRNFHWNLVGERFHSLHEFFEKQYGELEARIDQTAERIRMLGGVASGSMQEFLEHTHLKEAPGDLIEGGDSIAVLVNDYEQSIRILRDTISEVEEKQHDVGTADFLTSLLQAHEEAAWMLRSFLKRT